MSSPTFFKQLSQEEREALADLFSHEGWPALVKCVEQLVQDQERALLTLSDDVGPEKLYQEKLRSSGARKLRADFERMRELSRKSDKNQKALSRRP